ncbi:hypothetical protein [Psychromicrobium sp. YIM B11713]|uniref:hypothetical protein n=1 Tax=Psychromicrobium sp. YIM B11713 TaxID=3145233 RepID=UPI00374FDB9D
MASTPSRRFLPLVLGMALILTACSAEGQSQSSQSVSHIQLSPSASETETAGNVETSLTQPTGNWHYTGVADVTRAAILDGTVALEFSNEPSRRGKRATLSDFATISDPEAGFVCPGECSIGVAINKAAERKISASMPEGESSLTLENPVELWKELAGAKTLTLSFQTKAGPQTATFDLTGYQQDKLKGF